MIAVQEAILNGSHIHDELDKIEVSHMIQEQMTTFNHKESQNNYNCKSNHLNML